MARLEVVIQQRADNHEARLREGAFPPKRVETPHN